MRIQDVMVNLLLKQPFYGYIASSVTPVESSDTPTTSMATIPSLKLLYNREWFEGLKDEQAVGVVIHELLHLMLLHPYRKENREHHLWIIACDMAVNEHIDHRLLPEDAVTEKIAGEIKEALPPAKSAEFYYDIISKGEDRLSLLDGHKEIRVVLQSGQELKAVSSTDGDSSEINRKAFLSTMSEMIEQAGVEGEIPGGIGGYIDEIYKSQEVNWRNILKRFLTGKGRTLTRKTYKRESKRFENTPGTKRTTGISALLAVDESGSISQKQVSKFYNELLSIKRITGASISVTEFDTACTEPVPIGRYVRDKKRVKYGGTDFRPVFQLADKMRIPLLIIFTDGEGKAPESVNQNVLWVLTKGGKRPAGYGYCIDFHE
jgi:predicted metal-dependent peptidase